jgi:hypothetical protein
MVQMHYIRYGIISGLLLLCTTALSATEDGQRLVFAQITPAPEKAGDSSSDIGNSNDNDESSGSSSGSEAAEDSSGSNDNDESSGSSSGSDGLEDSSDSSEVDDSNESTTEDSGITTPEEESNPLLEAIMSKVTNELNAVGITDLGF